MVMMIMKLVTTTTTTAATTTTTPSTYGSKESYSEKHVPIPPLKPAPTPSLPAPNHVLNQLGS